MICPGEHGQKVGKYCDECGKELIRQSDEDPRKPFAVMGDDHCPGCGCALNHGHQALCPGCRHQLDWLCR